MTTAHRLPLITYALSDFDHEDQELLLVAQRANLGWALIEEDRDGPRVTAIFDDSDLARLDEDGRPPRGALELISLITRVAEREGA